MKTRKHQLLIRVIALAVLSGTLILWAKGGFHTGWTQTSVIEMHFDEVTEISYPVRHDTFIAGVDVLGVGVLSSLAVSGISLIGRRRQE